MSPKLMRALGVLLSCGPVAAFMAWCFWKAYLRCGWLFIGVVAGAAAIIGLQALGVILTIKADENEAHLPKNRLRALSPQSTGAK